MEKITAATGGQVGSGLIEEVKGVKDNEEEKEKCGHKVLATWQEKDMSRCRHLHGVFHRDEAVARKMGRVDIENYLIGREYSDLKIHLTPLYK